MRKNKLFKITIVLLVISIIYTILVKTIDVSAIGPEGSSVGFSTINGYMRDLIGYNDIWYKVTKYLGLLPFLIVAFYGLIGLKQLLERRNLFLVDKKILLLGCFYIALGLIYVFFEKVIINYRPFLQEGVLEASYPSSHTMLAICICGSSLYLSMHYIKNQAILKTFNICTIVLMVLLVVGRTLSGVHWFSDIIGGILISLTLLGLYISMSKYYAHNKKRL